MTGTVLEREIEEKGFSILSGLLSTERVTCLLSDLERTLPLEDTSVLSSRGQIYGVRNLIDIWPAALAVAQEPALREILTALLGKDLGMVRSIFFDKPPGRTWSLPWHRDLTIAVRDTRHARGEFRRPTIKAGIPHIEAPATLLRRMLTARVAVDDVTVENGPLLVIPSSHLAVDAHDLPSQLERAAKARPVLLAAGDVLLIRPLVVHRSDPSDANTMRHRRTLHFEFAPRVPLPDGLEWHQFVPMPS
jgi:ectoine hydroxylase-related dioxygenase (phytanoyl-CoA dioxygenase family)